MQILDVSQATETDAWLEARRGKITGTKSGGLALQHYVQKDTKKIAEYIAKNENMAVTAKTPEKARAYHRKAADYAEKLKEAKLANQRLNVTADFWQFLAELWAEEPSGESPMDRGHRLENQNAAICLDKLGIPQSEANFDPGIWVSDLDERLACSPDVHELSLEPTWAIECKSLGTPNHLMAVLPIIVRNMIRDGENVEELKTLAAALLPSEAMDPESRDFDFIPEKYKAQALQYFVVDEKLETLYFTFYDDRLYSETLAHCYLTIPRDSISTEIVAHGDAQLQALQLSDSLTNLLGVSF